MIDFTSSLLNEFEKLAFGPKDAYKVLQIAKKLQLPKAVARSNPSLAASNPSKKFREYWRRRAKLTGYPPDEYLRPGIMKITSHADRAGRGVILPGPKHFLLYGAGKDFRKAKRPNPMDGKNMRMSHAIGKGHELDELTVKPRMGASKRNGFNHVSPDVIFREHNKVVTLGNEFAPTKRLYRALREQDGENAAFFKPFGLEYGKGRRLSRHARRRLSEIIEDRSLAWDRKIKAFEDSLKAKAKKP